MCNSKKYTFLVTLRPLGVYEAKQSITILGKAKSRHVSKLTSVFHHLPSVGPKQLCALAYLGCTCEAGTY